MFDHVGLPVSDLERPRAFHAADYYAAFVLDPDGYNVEAVCRRPVP